MQAIRPSARACGPLQWLSALLATALLSSVTCLPVSARAQAEIAVIVPFPAGGSADFAARLFVARLRERGVQAVTVNMDGGSGLLAFRRILTAGHRTEILVGPATPMLIAAFINLTQRGKLAYMQRCSCFRC